MSHEVGWAINQLIAGHRVRRTSWRNQTGFLVRRPPPPAAVDTRHRIHMHCFGIELDEWRATDDDLNATDWILAG